MNILEQLSSSLKDKTEASNKALAEKCLAEPGLLDQIRDGLSGKDPKITADCAEVFTMVATHQPDLIKPYLNDLFLLLQHKNTKARWEAAHAISFVADTDSESLGTMIPDLAMMALNDKSTIVRDYATESIARYAGTGTIAAETALPYLKKILNQWKEKQARRVLEGMARACLVHPQLIEEVKPIATEYSQSAKGVVKIAALKLLKIR